MSSPEKNRSWLWTALIVLIAAGAHGRAVTGELVYQDALVIGHPQLPAPGLGDSLRQGFAMIAEPEAQPATAGWPVLPTLLRALSPLFGSSAVEALHVLSLLVHLLAVLALLRLAKTLGASDFSARAAALLFALHPAGVQSVAWISALSSPLAALFALIALERFERARAANELSILAGLAFLLALLSSALALAALPIAAFLFWFSPRDGERRARTLAPLLVALAVAWLLGSAAHGSLAQGFVGQLRSPTWGGQPPLWTPFAVLGSSVELLVWPTPQTLFRPIAPNLHLSDSSVLLGLGALAGFALLQLFARRAGHRLLGRSAMLALLSLAALALAGPWMPGYPVYDDHLYLALAFCALLVAALIERLPRLVAPTVALVLIGLCGATTPSYVSTWRDNLTLLASAAVATPDSPEAQWVYAFALLDDYGVHARVESLTRAQEVIEGAQDLLDEARQPESRIFATPVDYLNTNLALGGCMLALADVDGSEDYQTPREVFEAIIEARPDSAAARVGLGITLQAQGEFEASELAFRAALEIEPDSVEAHRKLGGLLMLLERWKEAQEQFERIVRVDPTNIDARVWLARSHLQQGWVERAEEQAKRAHELAPLFPEPMTLLGIIELKRGNPSQALNWIDRALKSEPKNGFARIQRGYAFQARNELGNAMVEFKRASELMPDSFEAFYSLGNSLLQMQQPEVAAEAFIRAYELHEPPEARGPLRDALAERYEGAAHVFFKLAGVDFRRADFASARYWVDRSLASDPEQAGALHLDGVLARLEGRSEHALQAFLAAARVVPDSFQVHHDLGYLLIEMERPTEAVPHLQRALELVPETPSSPDAAQRLREKIEASLAEIRGG